MSTPAYELVRMAMTQFMGCRCEMHMLVVAEAIDHLMSKDAESRAAIIENVHWMVDQKHGRFATEKHLLELGRDIPYLLEACWFNLGDDFWREYAPEDLELINKLHARAH